jgi:hypothetical protein
MMDPRLRTSGMIDKKRFKARFRDDEYFFLKIRAAFPGIGP